MSRISKAVCFVFFSAILYLVFLAISDSLPVALKYSLQTEITETSLDDPPSHLSHVKVENSSDEPDIIIGIEIGSTYSRVALYEEDNFVLLLNDHGEREVPSCVAFTNHGPIVGRDALEYGLKNPQNTICDIRQLLGRSFSDRTFQDELKSLPYEVVANKGGSPAVQLEINGVTQTIIPEVILSHLMASLKHQAEEYLGRKVHHAVATIPAHFNYTQIQALKNAGSLAGLEFSRIMADATAAAIGYGIDGKLYDDERLFLIYEIGEKYIQVTHLSLENGVFEIVNGKRDNMYGGGDLDNALTNSIIWSAIHWKGLDVRKYPETLKALKEEVTKAENLLLTEHEAYIQVPATGIFEGYSEIITRINLEGVKGAVLRKIKELGDQTLLEPVLAYHTTIRVDSILLVGDPKHIARIQPLIEEEYMADMILKNIPPDEAVIRGAASQARLLSSIESVHCDFILWEVSLLSLGMQSRGDAFTKVISRHSVIPTRKNRFVSTVRDGQSKIAIKVFEGERSLASKNTFLGVLDIDGIAPAPRGVPQIEVAFTLEDNFMLTVSAKEKVADREVKLVVQAADRYNQNVTMMMDDIIMEAERCFDEDEAILKLAREEQVDTDDEEFGFVIVDPLCVDRGQCSSQSLEMEKQFSNMGENGHQNFLGRLWNRFR